MNPYQPPKELPEPQRQTRDREPLRLLPDGGERSEQPSPETDERFVQAMQIEAAKRELQPQRSADSPDCTNPYRAAKTQPKQRSQWEPIPTEDWYVVIGVIIAMPITIVLTLWLYSLA